MGESNHAAEEPGSHPGGVALALQGGGAHGAFTWGVLDRLLQDGLQVTAVSGVSSGAIIAAMLVQGLVGGGAEEARAELRHLWHRVMLAWALNPLQGRSWEPLLWGFAWQGLEAMLRIFTPTQLNPLGHNPLRPLLAGLLRRERLSDPAAPRLTVAATDVETGAPVLFANAEIDVDVLLASSCLPMIFPAVEINGRAYWDGGFSANPPLAPLLMPSPPGELILIRAQPARRTGRPRTPMEIMNRLNEIACHNLLEAELAALPKDTRITVFDADAAVGELPVASKFHADPAFIHQLFEAGRAAAEARIAPPIPARI